MHARLGPPPTSLTETLTCPRWNQHKAEGQSQSQSYTGRKLRLVHYRPCSSDSMQSCFPPVRSVSLFVPFLALVPFFPFCTWRSLRWGMSGLTP
eukprot:364417-Chlamydomonas_euryale.AAC.12